MSRRQVVCVCDRVGTFVLVLSSFLETTNGDTFGGFEKVTGTGCIVCICFLSLTLSELVICWRHVSGAITALKIQFTSTVIGFYSIFLRASYGSLSQNYYLPVLSVLTFFLLSAFCMLLCVVLTVYVECVNMQCVNHLKLKIVLMGWGELKLYK
ncbi:adhesion G protein-coupled receptor B3-like [Limulus polyphemus]|uniref:Adhesion G protein-coupled receptor B3-like n=1 Tax=Limulus polyphemus TaxID=6850 RepID=A0ABM1RZS6_LIMPO|nr:adhesion G protein-coupled receptor B3-like [Limulus polyphemus]